MYQALIFATMWQIIRGLVVILVSSKAFGQQGFSFSGFIRDSETRQALPGASVFFADERIGTIADSTGHFYLANIPPGHHVVEISHTGYSTIVEHIELNKNAEINYTLSSIVIENQGVIVTGISGATNIRKAPVQVNILRRQGLLQTTATNIVDALTKIPGVSQISSGPGISKPVIRGLGYNRVVVINEGVRQEGQQWGDEHGLEIDEFSIARAEVWKGPASLMYGSDAIAGAVNFITHNPVKEGTVKANLVSNYQTNPGLYALNGHIAGNNRGFNWNVYGTYKSSGDYSNQYDGRVLNSRFNERNFGGYAGINKSWGFSHLIFSSFQQKPGLVEGERDDATGKFLIFSGSPFERIATNDELDSRSPFIPYQRIKHNKLVSDNNFVIAKSRLKLNLALQNNLRDEFGNPENPSEKELSFDLKTFNYTLHWQLPEVKEWHSTAGINGMKQWHRNLGNETLIPEYDLFDAGVFFYVQRYFNKTTFTSGLRYDHRNLESYFNKKFSNFSASAGVSYEHSPRFLFKANVARGFRAPTLAELASDGVHEGTDRYEYGDNNLRSETSLQVDGGIELNFEHFNVTASGFYNSIDDFVFYRKLASVFGGDSLVTVDGEDIPAYKFMQQNAKLLGFEAVIDIHPHPLDWLHFENSFSFVRGRFSESVDGSDNLPLLPPPKILSELRGNFAKAGNYFKNLYGKIDVEFNFDQEFPFTGYNTETATNSYTLVSASLGADIVRKENTLFNIGISLNNITDIGWQAHQSRLKYTESNMVTGRRGVYGMGRNFSIKLLIPIGFNIR